MYIKVVAFKSYARCCENSIILRLCDLRCNSVFLFHCLSLLQYKWAVFSLKLIRVTSVIIQRQFYVRLALLNRQKRELPIASKEERGLPLFVPYFYQHQEPMIASCQNFISRKCSPIQLAKFFRLKFRDFSKKSC